MTNFAAQLKNEIARIVRKETKGGLALQKANASKHRLEIAQLKKQLGELTVQVKHLNQRTVSQSSERRPPKSEDLPFGPAKLTASRHDFGLTQAQMALLLGVSTPSYSKYEAGKAQPRTAKLVKIVEVMALSKGAALARLKQLAKG